MGHVQVIKTFRLFNKKKRLVCDTLDKAIECDLLIEKIFIYFYHFPINSPVGKVSFIMNFNDETLTICLFLLNFSYETIKQ